LSFNRLDKSPNNKELGLIYKLSLTKGERRNMAKGKVKWFSNQKAQNNA